MKKLSKEQIKAMDALVASLRDTESTVNQMIAEANELIDKINEEMDKLQSEISDVESWRDEITSDMESFMDERSEKWQDSEAGEKYRDWKTQFDDIPFGETENIEQLEEISLGDEIASYLEQNISKSLDDM